MWDDDAILSSVGEKRNGPDQVCLLRYREVLREEGEVQKLGRGRTAKRNAIGVCREGAERERERGEGGRWGRRVCREQDAEAVLPLSPVLSHAPLSPSTHPELACPSVSVLGEAELSSSSETHHCPTHPTPATLSRLSEYPPLSCLPSSSSIIGMVSVRRRGRKGKRCAMIRYLQLVHMRE